jgi:hypothetical protein
VTGVGKEDLISKVEGIKADIESKQFSLESLENQTQKQVEEYPLLNQQESYFYFELLPLFVVISDSLGEALSIKSNISHTCQNLQEA